MSAPALVTVAHGTRVRAGNRVAAAITAAAGRRLGVPAQGSYVELCAPLFTSVVRSLEEPSVVVPLLLSTGFHVRHDLPEAMRRASAPVQVARPLGPHPLLAEVMCLRLRGSGCPGRGPGGAGRRGLARPRRRDRPRLRRPDAAGPLGLAGAGRHRQR